jgi:hypothetical protein
MKKTILTLAIAFSSASVYAQDFYLGIFKLGQNVSILQNYASIIKVKSDADFANKLFYSDASVLEMHTDPTKPNVRQFVIKEFQVDSSYTIKNLGMVYRNDSLIGLSFDFSPEINNLLHSYFGKPKIDAKFMTCKFPKEFFGKETELEILFGWALWQKGNVIASHNRYTVEGYEEVVKTFSIRYEDNLISDLQKCNCKDR